MEPTYYVAILKSQGWDRISRYFSNVHEAQDILDVVKRAYPNAFVVAEAKQPVL